MTKSNENHLVLSVFRLIFLLCNHDYLFSLLKLVYNYGKVNRAIVVLCGL